MANQEVVELDEACRQLLAQAGLDAAMALFPSDVLVAVRTAVNVRESFASLTSAVSGLSPVVEETDGI